MPPKTAQKITRKAGERQDAICNQYREGIGAILRELCRFKGMEIPEGSCVSTVVLNEAMIRKYSFFINWIFIVVYLAVHESPELRLQLFAVRQIQLISAYKDLICYVLQCVMHDQFILICTKDNANRLGISFLA